MTVPNVPYWLQPVHTEFDTSGAISNAGRAAGLPSQFWCSQFAGKSNLPRRIYHGMCNAMSDGLYTMQDTSLWGPGYTYVFEITACKNNRPMVSTIMVVDWVTINSINYWCDCGKKGASDLTYNQYFPFQFDNDGDVNEVWIGLRENSQFYFQMQEGRKHYNDSDLSCAIDVWIYELGAHDQPTLGLVSSADHAKATAWLVGKMYSGANILGGGSTATVPSYVRRSDWGHYDFTHSVTVGKKYKIVVRYPDGAGGYKVLGVAYIRVPDLSDIGVPFSGKYDTGGIGGFAMISFGGGIFGAWVSYFFMLPPTSYAAGATTKIRTYMDLLVTEVPD